MLLASSFLPRLPALPCSSNALAAATSATAVCRFGATSHMQCRGFALSTRVADTTAGPSPPSGGDLRFEKPHDFQLDHIKKRLEFTTPLMFRQRLDFTFYAKDVVLEDTIFNYKLEGLQKMINHLSIISSGGAVCFPHISMEPLRLESVVEDGTVRLNWRVHYITWAQAIFNPKNFNKEYRLKNTRWYDGYSMFYVDGSGLVYRMTIQKARPSVQSLKRSVFQVEPDEGRAFVKKNATQKIAEKIGVLPGTTNFARVERPPDKEGREGSTRR